MVQQKFAATHQEMIKQLEDGISQEANIKKAIAMMKSPQKASTSGTSVPNRTLASPEWQNDGPDQWEKALNLPSISVADFEASNTHP